MRGGERRGHHIRAVVDHFLPAAGDAAARGPVAPGARGAGARYRFAVAAPERGLLAAFACAHLARASLPPGGGPSPVRVRIEEWHRQPWSVLPFLGGDDRERLISLLEARAPAASLHSIGDIDVGTPGAGAGSAGDPGEPCGGVEPGDGDSGDRLDPGEPGDPRVTVVTWLNLGRLSAEALATFEAARARGRERGGPGMSPPMDGLVWCFTAAEGRLMDGAYRLGRILAALAPAQLKLLLFPDAWAGAGAAAGFVAGPDPIWTAAAASGTPLERVSHEGGPEWLDPASDVEEPAVSRDRLFRRLVASLELGAASLRRACVVPARHAGREARA